MALANGVEVRYPFLEPEVVDYACRLPAKFKINGNQEKYILRRLADSGLPHELANREKFAFTAPGGAELFTESGGLGQFLLSDETIIRHGVFDVAGVQALKKKYEAPNFRLNVPFERDLLFFIATFGLFMETFKLSRA